MNKVVLVTRPNHDETTNYLDKWSEPIIKLANQKNYKLIDLRGEKATRSVFEGYARKHHPSFFFLNGHGSEKIIAGQNNEYLLVYKENETLCAGAVLYVRSCSAAKLLGQSLVTSGARACIGYTSKFGFMRLLSSTTKPILDPLAKLFIEPANLVATTLLKGHSVLDAHQRGISGMKKNLKRMLSSESTQQNSNAVVLLWSNIRGQVVIGDSSATI